MRPIDADALSGQMNERLRCCNKGSIVEACLLAELDLVNAMPTITSPPNDPLTLDELKEMDGEIVYCVPLNEWIKPTKTGIAFLGTSVQLKWGEIAHKCGKTWFAYRRKPEEVSL